MSAQRAALLLIACLSGALPSTLAHAAMSNPVTYNGNGNNGHGGTVASGSLTLKDNGTTVTGTFTKGSGTTFQLDLVIYIDSVAGGFLDTTSLRDNADSTRTAISGFSRAQNKGSTATFAPGFTADYAIVLGVNPSDNVGNALYRLNAGGDGSLVQIGSVYLSPNNDLTSPTYTFQFDWSAIGISKTDAHYFKFQSTYIYGSTGSRTLESFEFLSGQAGYNPITFSNYNTYGVAPVPEMASSALLVFGGLFAGSRLLTWAGGFRRKRQAAAHHASQDL